MPQQGTHHRLNIKTPRIVYKPQTEGKRVYLAGRPSNPYFGMIKFALEHSGYDVYDHRTTSFDWDNYTTDTSHDLSSVLRNEHELIEARDHNGSALQNCDACVLALPAGVSSHGEAMIALGLGKRVYVLALNNYADPTLLYGYLPNGIFTDLSTLVEKMKWDKDCQ